MVNIRVKLLKNKKYQITINKRTVENMSVNSGLVQDSRIVQRILCDNIMNRDMLMKYVNSIRNV